MRWLVGIVVLYLLYVWYRARAAAATGAAPVAGASGNITALGAAASPQWPTVTVQWPGKEPISAVNAYGLTTQQAQDIYGTLRHTLDDGLAVPTWQRIVSGDAATLLTEDNNLTQWRAPGYGPTSGVSFSKVLGMGTQAASTGLMFL